MAKFLGFPCVCKCSFKEFSKEKIPFEKAGIYAIVNKKTDVKYIGQAAKIYTRLRGHFRELNINKHPNKILQRSFNKYGQKWFEFVVIEFCAKEYLTAREIVYLKFAQKGNVFNILECMDSMLGWKHSEKTKIKISENSAVAEPVKQFDKKGNFIAEYSSIRQAAIENGFSSPVPISFAVAGKYNTAFGFKWEYVNEEKKKAADELIKQRIIKNKELKIEKTKRLLDFMRGSKGKTVEEIYGQESGSRLREKNMSRQKEMSELAAKATRKKIGQFTMDGQLIKTYESATEAEFALVGRRISGIKMVCIGKKKSYRGFLWKYL